mgnify:CR=1 FL=1
MKERTDRELSEKRRQLEPADIAVGSRVSLDESLGSIRKTLDAVTDPGSGDNTELLDKIIDSVELVNERKFIFRVRYENDHYGSVLGEASGRKNTAIVSLGDIEDSSDGEPSVHIIVLDISSIAQKRHRLQ